MEGEVGGEGEVEGEVGSEVGDDVEVEIQVGMDARAEASPSNPLDSYDPLELRTRVRASRSQAYLSRAMYFEARDDATAVLSIDPAHVEALRCLALSLDGLGRHTEALALMEVRLLLYSNVNSEIKLLYNPNFKARINA